LCAVATNVNPSGENWKTPDITGRKSSFPAAKIVLLIAVAKTSAGTSVTEGSKLTDFGNSSPGHTPKHIYQNRTDFHRAIFFNGKS
jgi:hypothetical protein